MASETGSTTRLVPPADLHAGPRVPRPVMSPPAERGLWVNEVFVSVQGEGRTAGLPTVFLRTTGCHLRCVWCDTPYSFHEGEWRAWDGILGELDEKGVRRLCLTGGEPLLQRDAWPLVRHLVAGGWHVTIETSGSISLSEADAVRNMLGEEARSRLVLSVDVKCPGSGEEKSWRRDNLAHLTAHDQLKFIIADRGDYEYAREWVRAHAPLACPVYFHPEGGVAGTLLTEIAEWILADRLDVRLGVQLHKLAWGERRGV